MGHNRSNQDRLFYSFNLDEHIPQNHLLRGIDRCLDLSELRQQLADYYSHTGRPSIDPDLMIRMLIWIQCGPLMGTLLPMFLTVAEECSYGFMT